MEKLTFTYFIQDEFGNIKIGRSVNPEKRFAINQVGNASKLSLILYIIGNKEKQLHQKFDFYRIRNSEWFKPNKQLKRYINERIEGFELIKEKKKFQDSKIEEQKERKEEMIKHIKRKGKKEDIKGLEEYIKQIKDLEEYIKQIKNSQKFFKILQKNKF